jgi:hypothetical protein
MGWLVTRIGVIKAACAVFMETHLEIGHLEDEEGT